MRNVSGRWKLASDSMRRRLPAQTERRATGAVRARSASQCSVGFDAIRGSRTALPWRGPAPGHDPPGATGQPIVTPAGGVMKKVVRFGGSIVVVLLLLLVTLRATGFEPRACPNAGASWTCRT